MVDVCVPLAARRVLIMPNGLFTSTNFEDAKGLFDEPLNLSDVAKGFSGYIYGLEHPHEGHNKRDFLIYLEEK